MMKLIEGKKYQIRSIKNFKNYYISSCGEVFKRVNKNKPHRKRQWIKLKGEDVFGYRRVSMSNEIGVTRVRVHRLVAEYFLENDDPDVKTQVDHLNNIKDDNRVENLEWVTPSENSQRAQDDKLVVNDKGFQDCQSIPVKVSNIETGSVTIYGSMSICAKELGIHKSTVSRNCKKGHAYKGYLVFEPLNKDEIDIESNDYRKNVISIT